MRKVRLGLPAGRLQGPWLGYALRRSGLAPSGLNVTRYN
jgi:hypothetical protein